MQIQSDLFVADAARRRDKAISRVAAHADDDAAGWIEDAALAIGTYARTCGHAFLIEDAREASRLPDPPDARAWGAAARRAAALGLIQRVGYAPSRSSNLSPKVLWKASHA